MPERGASEHWTLIHKPRSGQIQTPPRGKKTIIDLHRPGSNTPQEWVHSHALKFHMPDTIKDLVEISYLITCADELFPRKKTNAYQREYTIEMPVRDLGFWPANKEHLERLVNFISNDRVDFVFRAFEHQELTPLPDLDRSEYYKPRVTMFSGGADSFVGCLEESREHPDEFAVYSYSPSRGYSFHALQSTLHRLIPDFPVQYWERDTSQNLPIPTEPTNEHMEKISRMFRYLTNAYALAVGVNADTIAIYENGVIGHGISPTMSRWGAGITRSTNPKFLSDFINLANNASGRNIQIERPYHILSKTQVLEKALDYGLGQSTLFQTVSCSSMRFFNARGHCGTCLPCIIRRVSERNAYRGNETPYDYIPERDGHNQEYQRNLDDIRNLTQHVANGSISLETHSDIAYLDFEDLDVFMNVIGRFHAELNDVLL